MTTWDSMIFKIHKRHFRHCHVNIFSIPKSHKSNLSDERYSSIIFPSASLYTLKTRNENSPADFKPPQQTSLLFHTDGQWILLLSPSYSSLYMSGCMKKNQFLWRRRKQKSLKSSFPLKYLLAWLQPSNWEIEKWWTFLRENCLSTSSPQLQL